MWKASYDYVIYPDKEKSKLAEILKMHASTLLPFLFSVVMGTDDIQGRSTWYMKTRNIFFTSSFQIDNYKALSCTGENAALVSNMIKSVWKVLKWWPCLGLCAPGNKRGHPKVYEWKFGFNFFSLCTLSEHRVFEMDAEVRIRKIHLVSIYFDHCNRRLKSIKSSSKKYQ